MTDPNACQWRAVHEPDVDGLCRHCFKPVPAHRYSVDEICQRLIADGCRLALYTADGQEPQPTTGYRRAIVPPQSFARIGCMDQLANIRPIMFPMPTAAWGTVLSVAIFLNDGTELARMVLTVPVAVDPEMCRQKQTPPMFEAGHFTFTVEGG